MKHFFERKGSDSHDFWMSYTDLMSGFLIIFLIASLIYYNKSSKDLEKWEKIKPLIGNMVNMNNEFKPVFENINDWEIIDSLGSIRIYPSNAAYLFKKDSPEMEENLKERLDAFGHSFVKKAMTLVMDGKNIQEIRIEGHADSDGIFMNNLSLSSARAISVYSYIHDRCGLSDEEKRFMEKHIIAVGYSSAVSVLNKYSQEDKDKSRRIEFRIIGKDTYSIQNMLNNSLSK